MLLTIVTAGVGAAASVRHAAKLKKLKPLLEKLIKLLKRKRLKKNKSGPHDTTLTSTNRLRAGDSKDGTIGAKNVDEGVNAATVFSGHGAHSNKLTTVPEGTSVTVYSGPGGSITDKLGNKIETGGDLSKVPKKTYHSGEQMPDNILYEPKGLDIKGNPVTVEKPTRLSGLLKPDMGECHWAACTSASGEKFSDTVFHTDGMYDQLGNKIKSYD